MDIWFEDLDALISHINSINMNTIGESAVQTIAKEVEAILLKHIKSDIYGAYTPHMGAWIGGSTYQRRHVLEGGIKSTLEADGTLLVTSDAPAGQCVVDGYSFSNADSGFLQLLESGHMGIWRNGFARPAVSNAQREVDSSSSIQNIFEKALQEKMGGA